MVRVVCALWLVASLFSVGCTPPPTTPSGAGAPALGVQAPGRRGVPQGPVQVTYFAPHGDTEVRVQVSVAFDRPMVALGSDVGAADVLQVTPQVPGRARWVGSQTVVFEPAHDLPGATTFQVRVPKGLRALDGNVLSDGLVFEFSTPRPKVVSTSPGNGAERELPARAFELFFNQAVSPEAVRRVAKLTVEAGDQTREVEFSVSRPSNTDPKQIRVTPSHKLPLAAGAHLVLGAELLGEEGPSPMGEAFETSFRVYGPLQFAPGDLCADSGGRCSPSGGTTIRFTNPVKIKDALKQLRFDPPLPEPLSAYDEDYVSEYVYVSQELAPLTKYTVKLEGDLVDAYGNHFSGQRTRVLSTGPFEPWAYFPVDGDLLQAGKVQRIGVRMSNLAAPKLNLYALKPDEIDALASGRELLPKSKAKVSALPAVGGDKRTRVEIDPTPVLNQGKGVFLAAVTDKKNPSEPFARTLLAVTNLAPTLKFGQRAGVVWVTDLEKAQPVSGATVRLSDCGAVVATGSTDSKGMWNFQLGAAPQCELFAIVEKDGDVSFTHQYAGVGPWDLTSHSGYEAEGEQSAFVFTERGVYRPGETMRLKGILRRHGQRGLAMSTGQVSVRVADSQDREIEQMDLELDAFGSFSRAIRIPGSVSLGPLAITVTQGEQTFHTSAEVAEFRRAELEVDVRSEKEHVIRGQKAKLKVNAQYLFGAPVAHQAVVWSARRVVRDARPAGEAYEGFAFDDETRWFEDTVSPESTTLEGAEAKLDEHGELMLEVPSQMELESGAAGLEVEATVDGLGGASASGRTVLTVTPAAFMVGLRPSTSLITADQKFAVEVAAAKLDGAPVSKVALEVSLERRVFFSELKEGQAGRTEHAYQHRDEVVQTCKVTTKQGFGRCELTPKAPGLHFARVTGRDAKGRVVKAALPLYAYGAGEASWEPSEGPVITLKADRERYQLGQRAKILVASPFDEAEALVSVEREGVVSVEQRHLVGKAATLEVNVDERFIPNAFVTVLLVRPRVASRGEDSGEPAFRVGSVELATDVSEHHLSVKVRPDAPEKRPGETVEVNFEVVNAKGKAVPSELTVFAVDEGVLALTGYRTPDPFDVLYAPRALSVWTADARGRLARAAAGEDDKGGSEGGGGGDAMTMRKDFDAVAFYAPDVVTDEAGRAKVSFKLPDSLTRYRIMAVAASRGADLGSGEAAVRTKKPLMLRPALPRVVRVGDSFSAGAVLHNESDRDLEVELKAEVQGLTMSAPNTRKLSLAKGAASEVRFPLRADGPGEAKLRFVAKAQAESDGLELTRAVLLPLALEAVSSSGHTDERASEALAALKGVRPDVGGLEVRVSTTALATLEAPAKALFEYPYGCTEQLSSKLIGMSGLARLEKRGVLESPGLAKRVELVLGELERHQRSDGGFGLWSSEESFYSPSLTAFLTSYALLAMEEVKRAGFVVAPHAAENARLWLSQYLRGDERASSELDRASVAFVAYALARTGNADASYAGKLFEDREKLDSGFSGGACPPIQRAQGWRARVRAARRRVRTSARDGRRSAPRGEPRR
ncbi:MAG: alpha-2-macroglobulin family protein [Myxococcales bacterium]